MSTTPDPRNISWLPLNELNENPANPKAHDLPTIDASIDRFGVLDLIVLDERTNQIISGHGRKNTLQGMAARQEDPPDGVRQDDDGNWLVPVVTGWSSRSDNEAKAALIAMNRTTELGGWNDEALMDLLDDLDAAGEMTGVGYTAADLEVLQQDIDDTLSNAADQLDSGPLDDDPDNEVTAAEQEEAAQTLAERFGAPPISVLDANQGYWINRKRAWTRLGIASAEGRDEELIYQSGSMLYNNWYEIKNRAQAEAGEELSEAYIIEHYEDQLVRYNQGSGTSIFDPVLAEIIYAWFSSPGDRILDPWAGGSVRGIVAALTGREYHGIELRPEQIDRNEHQWDHKVARHDLEDTAPTISPAWHEGSSPEHLTTLEAGQYHMAIGCPPYYDLETYSDDDRDLSNMSYQEFDDTMLETLQEVERLLADNSFAIFVVGNVRNKKGELMDMREGMNKAARKAGLHLANTAILRTPIGGVALTAGSTFNKGRAMLPAHQEVLIYVKGDRKKAAKRLGEPELMAMPEPETPDTDD